MRDKHTHLFGKPRCQVEPQQSTDTCSEHKDRFGGQCAQQVVNIVRVRLKAQGFDRFVNFAARKTSTVAGQDRVMSG
jgi:hypothetical protein